ncbi:hypothetical protein CEXT_445511 [Caerostris extrusa]|uniref:Uncharacterized protein n=1 Tax=Caerostris extrusa TaxID=172846 RepID=A0AAV4PMZ2_CAEEX|nr:hypothetical protein CEXT_445511 [Caerostris extrusa]
MALSSLALQKERTLLPYSSTFAYSSGVPSPSHPGCDGLENVASWPDGDGLKNLTSRHNEICEENRSSVGRSRVNRRNSFLRKDRPRLLMLL